MTDEKIMPTVRSYEQHEITNIWGTNGSGEVRISRIMFSVSSDGPKLSLVIGKYGSGEQLYAYIEDPEVLRVLADELHGIANQIIRHV